MFPYFGSKGRIAREYPAPLRGGRVFEPFAGSARYSLFHRHRDVWLNDIDPLVYRIWRYIQHATIQDIKALPVLKAGESLDQCRGLSEVERKLMGFCLGYSQVSPRVTCTEWADRKQRCRMLKERLLEHREIVRGWTVTNLHYGDLPDEDGTWFIDPPYQHSKGRYRYHCVSDYDRLAEWCRSRRGRVIVCEGHGADWLPFRPLVKQQVGTGRMYQEMIWKGPE